MTLQSFYINVDQAVERKNFLEQNYRQFMPPEWSCSRVSAVTPEQLSPLNQSQAYISLNERACFASHVRALDQSLANEQPVLILEDDALFGPQSFQIIRDCLQGLQNTEWDILYTDVCIPHPSAMLEFFQLRKVLIGESRWQLFDLSQINYAGATAYVINGRSKQKIHALCKGLPQLSLPYDLQLRQWVQTKILKAFTVFPFATTLSTYAESSQIQSSEGQIIDQAWNNFRRLIWVGADALPQVDLVDAQTRLVLHSDARSERMAAIMATVLAEQRKSK
jgi:GR25 family glycosyltransferase involved in LPS biosynthesis